MAHNIPLIEKYRPKDVADIISQKAITDIILNFVKNENIPHMLFYGPPGTGKTTTISIISREINKENPNLMILDMNASDNRGIDTIRKEIKYFAETKQIDKGHKMVILDEADSMTYNAQIVLKKIIETYTQNVKFIIIGNYINNIILPIRSRCVSFRFTPTSFNDMKKRMNHIVKEENIKITNNALNSIINSSNGDMRKCLNLLQSASMISKTVKDENVFKIICDIPPQQIENIHQILLTSSFKEGYNSLNKLIDEYNINVDVIVKGLHNAIIKQDIPPNNTIYLLKELSKLECRLLGEVDINIQISSLVAIYQGLLYSH
jgi:replication factor C subunit 3/5